MNKIDIGTILASLIHESKNTVGHLMHLTQTIKSDFSGSSAELEQIENIESGLKRLNDGWVEYLYLYKLASDGYDIQCETYQVDEFLDDQVFTLEQAAKEKNIALNFDCQEGLLATYDERLLTSVVSTGFYNSLRFAKADILFKAEVANNFLVISIEDDGCGFNDGVTGEDEVLKSHNTSLGLYFAELCANAHSSHGQSGYIEKSSSETLGGASLKIYLPQ